MRLLLLAAVLAPACAAVVPPDTATSAGTEPLTIATFNIRYGSFSGDEAWNGDPGRGELVTAQAAMLSADLLGLQEALIWQTADLAEALPGHDWVGVGREDGDTIGEMVPLFYRADRLTLLEAGHFWLSETPDTPGTTFDGAATNRMATWARLRDAENGRTLLALNTHWDHVSADARAASAQLIAERVGALAQPGDQLVVMGDLNATEDSPSVAALREALALADGYRAQHPEPDGQEATYHGFTGSTAGLPIDFVLLGGGLRATAASLERWSDGGAYPSDHYPVLVVAEPAI